jgi:hypothetical protein
MILFGRDVVVKHEFKKRLLGVVAGVVTAMFGGVAANAEELPRLQLGAWEQTIQLEAPQFKGLPPAIAQQLVKQLGEKKTRLCITSKEQNGLMDGFLEGSEGRCAIKDVSRKGNIYSWVAACSGDNELVGSGSVRSTFTMNKSSESAYTVNVVSKGQIRGNPMAHSMSIEGRYLGANCKSFGAKTGEEVLEGAKKKGQALAENPFIAEMRRKLMQDQKG